MVDFEGGWNPKMGNYCRKLVEFCSGKAVSELCHNIEGNINVGSFSRLIYDMMLAWERPSYYDEEPMVCILFLSLTNTLYIFGTKMKLDII